MINFGGVNLKLRIIILMLGMTTLMPGICFADDAADSTLLHRIWNYRRNFSQPVNGLQQNVYMRYSFSTERRNVLLFLVPTMYVLAKGDRDYIGESYCKLKFRDIYDYDQQRQVVCGTIPRNRTAMPAMLEYITPNLYNETLYPEHLLSPFHQTNRRCYRYQVNIAKGGLSVVHFRPRMNNTQLVSGSAVIDTETGRVQFVQFDGEFDMLRFQVTALMDKENLHTPLPEKCTSEATFKFLGNEIKASFTAVFNCPTTLPDSINNLKDRQLMEQLRPVPLTQDDLDIYNDYDSRRLQEQKADTVAVDSTQAGRHNWIKEIGWDLIGDNLINGHRSKSGPVAVRISPLLNPLYLGYSHSRGISYKARFGLRYSWNTHRFLTLNPQLGYNFKQEQFYYKVPLRMTYNPNRNGYAEIIWANGNHISNGVLTDDMKKKFGPDIDVPDYKDRYLHISNNVIGPDWMEITTGVIHHQRLSTNRRMMRELGMPDKFMSFGPLITLKFFPWKEGPTLTANFEHSFKNVLKSNLNYERWELDAVYKCDLKSLRYLNARVGSGFYTKRSSNYFVDFINFRDNNLPSDWEDEWSGQFQLLSSRMYNASNYYFRTHISYDSPLLILNRLPLAGRFIETERLYFSTLSIEHTKPYFELGYGFKNRLFSTGIFTSLLGTKIQDFECKFTIEIFRRW